MEQLNYIEKIKEATKYILKSLNVFKPEIAIVLGSGLGDFADEIQNKTIIPYCDIPYFPVSTVVGHKGQFVAGTVSGKNVICMQGRFHYYEGYDLKTVTLPIRTLKSIGVAKLLITNAAGGINENFKPGNLMLIKDHINLTGQNPLIGANLDEFGKRFIDMTSAYDKNYLAIAREKAKALQMNLKEGSYAWFTGPTYETPSEVRYIKTVGADAVGMSTVPEVIVARHMDMRVLGISCITNMAAGILDKPLDHSEVTQTANSVKDNFTKLILSIIGEM